MTLPFRSLAAGLESGEVRLLDVASGWQVATLAGHGGPVRWLGLHPDGRSLAAAGPLTDNTVFVRDLATRTQPRRLSGRGSEVLSGASRADGRILVTAGTIDGTVRLWDLSGEVPRLKALPVITPNVNWLHGIVLTPEGCHLAVCNPNGTVYVLRLAKAGEVFQVPASRPLVRPDEGAVFSAITWRSLGAVFALEVAPVAHTQRAVGRGSSRNPFMTTASEQLRRCLLTARGG